MANQPGDKTPLMRQYMQIKSKYPDAILLFRVGDFYETFADDAVKASGILGITLTHKSNGTSSYTELAGFPYHALDTYLPKLVRAGQRVAICEQLEDPKTVKTLVKRGITELITPGISLNDNVLENKINNYAAAICLQKDLAGVAFLDISTGEFLVAEGKNDYIDKLLSTLQPKEILYERRSKEDIISLFGSKYYFYPLEDWAFEPQTAHERLLRQFETASLKGFGIDDMTCGITAAGAIMHYLDITRHEKLDHIVKISRLNESNYVWLDKFTVRNLEIFYPLNPSGKSLLDIIDKTSSPQGGRMLRRRIGLPLKDVEQINRRLDFTQALINNDELLANLKNLLKQIGDLERLTSKVATQRINPREIKQLAVALNCAAEIKNLLSEASDNNEIFKSIAEKIEPCVEISERINNEIVEDPPILVSKGNIIKQGVNAELDNLRNLSANSREYLNSTCERLAKITGIASLKLGYNNVFGYYLEVRNTYKQRVPQEWIRKQTLTDAERYITPELKEYEDKILNSQERILALESEALNSLISYLSNYIKIFLDNADIVARVDCITSYASCAIENRYNRPIINTSNSLKITGGRHPVIEKGLPVGEDYIPNDVCLDNESTQIMMITGPNMAGKSALLRQTALIMILAQAGSFVPAQSVEAGYVDKIFTRVGASDNISAGESTFMVEMNEAAGILNNISARSLVLFDELGRGTSTYDGISIARAIVEYIHEYPARAKTLFATHYHELNEMESEFERIKNFNVSVKEQNGKVIFMRKLVPGGSEHSFGIHVAKLAGMPPAVVTRANQIMKDLESGNRSERKNTSSKSSKSDGIQLSFYNLEDPVLTQIRDEIKNLDINNLTPVEALNKLNEIKKLSGLK